MRIRELENGLRFASWLLTMKTVFFLIFLFSSPSFSDRLEEEEKLFKLYKLREEAAESRYNIFSRPAHEAAEIVRRSQDIELASIDAKITSMQFAFELAEFAKKYNYVPRFEKDNYNESNNVPNFKYIALLIDGDKMICQHWQIDKNARVETAKSRRKQCPQKLRKWENFMSKYKKELIKFIDSRESNQQDLTPSLATISFLSQTPLGHGYMKVNSGAGVMTIRKIFENFILLAYEGLGKLKESVTISSPIKIEDKEHILDLTYGVEVPFEDSDGNRILSIQLVRLNKEPLSPPEALQKEELKAIREFKALFRAKLTQKPSEILLTEVYEDPKDKLFLASSWRFGLDTKEEIVEFEPRALYPIQ